MFSPRKNIPIIQADNPWPTEKSPEDKLLLAILIGAIKDYMKIHRIKKCHWPVKRIKNEKARISQNKYSAAAYIFFPKKESDDWLFGFVSICKHFNIDPKNLRKKILEYMKKNSRRS